MLLYNYYEIQINNSDVNRVRYWSNAIQLPIYKFTMNYVVGKYYLKECIWSKDAWIPVIGKPHIDYSNCLNTPILHYHADSRFFENVDVTRVYAAINNHGTTIKITKVMKKCYRTFLETPSDPLVLYSLIRQYKNKKINCKICPHKKVPLENLEPDKDGLVRCPGHGLRFDIKKHALALVNDWYIIIKDINNQNKIIKKFDYPLKVESDENITFNKVEVYEKETNIFVGTIQLDTTYTMVKGDRLNITCK